MTALAEPLLRPRVVLTGAASPLGERVMRQLDEQGADVQAVDFDTLALGVGGGQAAEWADIVVDLGSSDYDARAAQRESTTWFTAATLAAADSSRARHVVFVSSAMVYGAFANNPVPLTEEAVLRPDVEFVFARQLASAEELVEQWRLADPARSTTVLRPVIPVAADGSSRLATAYVAGLGRRLAEDDPPSQFLHLDDLASAITAAIGQRLDGVFNVAPDGWVPGERVRALSGERPRVPLPERAAEVVSRLRWQFQRGPIPPGLRSYTLEPWVVANGRLRTSGWEPTVTNEQAYVESTESKWWTMISPKRRQELALGAGVLAAIAGVAVAIVVGRRQLRRRRRL
jgi:nucleoside-diphosphate-sugar epimerase